MADQTPPSSDGISAARRPLPEDPGGTLMRLLCAELIRRLTDNPKDMTSSEMEVIRKLLTDNSVTLAHVRRGDFGKVAQAVAEEFPFDDDGNVVPMKASG